MGLNPFDLPGPGFLAFYLVAATLAIVSARRWQHRLESGDPAEDGAVLRGLAPDPYRIACLRAGKDEVLRVAVVSLLERGLLEAKGDQVVATRLDAVDQVRRPLDKAILSWAASARSAQDLFDDAVIMAEAEAVGAPLRQERLLPDARLFFLRCRTFGIMALALVLVAGTKIGIALARGRTNIAFLVILAIAALVATGVVVFRRRTSRGERLLGRLGGLFAPLRERGVSTQGRSATGELCFLGAVYGVGSLPDQFARTLDRLQLKRRVVESSSGGCGSGSSCGGGGGCGSGGCGGCGGG